MKQTLLRYARYNQWANASILNLVKKEGHSFLDKEMTSSFNSIRKTILHIADAEYIWYARLTEVKAELIISGLPSKTGMGLEALTELDQKHVNLILSKEEDFFNLFTAYQNLKGEAFRTVNSAIFWQVFNHATFHRGQVVTLMRMNGYTGLVESTDFIGFDRLG